MRILILSQYCYPEPDLKSLPLAIELKSQGFQVEILTGYPNHPLGKIYEGYKMRFLQSEYIDGIKVNRVPLFIDHSNSKIKRIFIM
jgi:colanic acid biosynthesis glycosyl transferase WcaI